MWSFRLLLLLAALSAAYATPACPVNQILAASGTLSHRNYLNYEDCTWIAPIVGGAMIWINSFSTEDCCDYLTIYVCSTSAGCSATTGRIVATLRGVQPVQSFSVDGMALLFKFHSDSSVTSTGFDLTYSSVNNGTTLGPILSGQVLNVSIPNDVGGAVALQTTTDSFFWVSSTVGNAVNLAGQGWQAGGLVQGHAVNSTTSTYVWTNDATPVTMGLAPVTELGSQSSSGSLGAASTTAFNISGSMLLTQITRVTANVSVTSGEVYVALGFFNAYSPSSSPCRATVGSPCSMQVEAMRNADAIMVLWTTSSSASYLFTTVGEFLPTVVVSGLAYSGSVANGVVRVLEFNNLTAGVNAYVVDVASSASTYVSFTAWSGDGTNAVSTSTWYSPQSLLIRQGAPGAPIYVTASMWGSNTPPSFTFTAYLNATTAMLPNGTYYGHEPQLSSVWNYVLAPALDPTVPLRLVTVTCQKLTQASTGLVSLSTGGAMQLSNSFYCGYPAPASTTVTTYPELILISNLVNAPLDYIVTFNDTYYPITTMVIGTSIRFNFVRGSVNHFRVPAPTSPTVCDSVTGAYAVALTFSQATYYFYLSTSNGVAVLPSQYSNYNSGGTPVVFYVPRSEDFYFRLTSPSYTQSSSFLVQAAAITYLQSGTPLTVTLAATGDNNFTISAIAGLDNFLNFNNISVTGVITSAYVTQIGLTNTIMLTSPMNGLWTAALDITKSYILHVTAPYAATVVITASAQAYAAQEWVYDTQIVVPAMTFGSTNYFVNIPHDAEVPNRIVVSVGTLSRSCSVSAFVRFGSPPTRTVYDQYTSLGYYNSEAALTNLIPGVPIYFAFTSTYCQATVTMNAVFAVGSHQQVYNLTSAPMRVLFTNVTLDSGSPLGLQQVVFSFFSTVSAYFTVRVYSTPAGFDSGTRYISAGGSVVVSNPNPNANYTVVMAMSTAGATASVRLVIQETVMVTQVFATTVAAADTSQDNSSSTKDGAPSNTRIVVIAAACSAVVVVGIVGGVIGALWVRRKRRNQLLVGADGSQLFSTPSSRYGQLDEQFSL